MNCSIRSFSNVVLALFLLLSAQSSFALTVQHGTICRPGANTDPSGFYPGINGVHNVGNQSMSVVCPVVRTISAPARGYSVWVDGFAPAGAENFCALYSFNYDGTLMGWVSKPLAPSQLLTLPASQVPYYSSQVVACYMPPNGILRHIQPVQ